VFASGQSALETGPTRTHISALKFEDSEWLAPFLARALGAMAGNVSAGM
jgi:hypothetical protein